MVYSKFNTQENYLKTRSKNRYMKANNKIDLAAFRKQGYCLVKGLFDPKQVDEIKSELSKVAALEGSLEPGAFVLEDKHEEIRKRSKNPLDWIRKIDYPAMSKSEYLMKLFQSNDADIVQIARQIIGERNLQIIYFSTFAKPPHGGAEIPWHQDQALWDLWMNTALSGWVALSKTTDENGVLQFVPGTNLGGIVPHRHYPGKIHESIRIGDYPDATPVRVYMDPGDCVFHHDPHA